jgi:hypothetical protein
MCLLLPQATILSLTCYGIQGDPEFWKKVYISVTFQVRVYDKSQEKKKAKFFILVRTTLVYHLKVFPYWFHYGKKILFQSQKNHGSYTYSLAMANAVLCKGCMTYTVWHYLEFEQIPSCLFWVVQKTWMYFKTFHQGVFSTLRQIANRPSESGLLRTCWWSISTFCGFLCHQWPIECIWHGIFCNRLF